MAVPLSNDFGAMDLPKGIVEDDVRIYEVFASQPEIPLAALIAMWKIYTTTSRELHDPTARRLEHFFWHIYNSDRRHLKPRTIAALWQAISTGPTFAPLLGPPNRYEPPPNVLPPQCLQLSAKLSPKPKAESEQEPRPSEPQPQPEPEPEASSKLRDDEILAEDLPKAVPEPSMVVGTPTIRELSASSSRPPPPHPILKKSRGDSKTGPRPTARFASPPDSEEESRPDEDNSSSSTAAAHLERATSTSTTPPGRSSKRRGGTPTKKFVVATSAAKRRPVLPRRPSSQSSTGSSEMISRHGGSSAGSRMSGSQHGSLTSNPERPDSNVAVESVPEEPPVMSAKARGKQPATGRSPRERRQPPQRVTEAPKPSATPRREDIQPAPVEQKPSLPSQDVEEAVKSSPAVASLPSAAAKPASAAVTEEPAPAQRPKANGTERMPRRTSGPTSAPTQMATSYGSAITSTSGGTGRRTSGSTSGLLMGTSFNSVATSSTSGGLQMERSTSNTEYPRARPTSMARISSYGLLSNAVASTTNIEAMGQLSATDDPALQSLHRQAASASDPDNPYLTRNVSVTSFAPTLASPTPPVPLARPRSQLTLLLEKENAKRRPGVKARSKS
ncbi:hypothetical protein B0T11DRAFT_102817 [Plectosphaerella cucumerina]|uniref:Nitrogen regulatory protein areA GATA-like domain-containing protein n=1 Tax=Plectosphaerella cucumerina TaxID=40658 RepID=A0A8K0X1L1_9PEZI|nr:hypothetical protein B0T11DRAFT_102817 [Plectosphaerella cucumerina]